MNRSSDALFARARRRLTVLYVVIIGAVLALCVGIPYYLLGPGIGFSIFYLIPIALTTWYAGRWAGIVISVVGPQQTRPA